MDVVPEEKCSYTPKRICHQVEESPKKVPRGGKKRSLVGLDAVRVCKFDMLIKTGIQTLLH